MLTLMTLNVNLYEETHGAWPRRRRVIEDAAQQARVDVLALQAARRHADIENGEDQAAQLARALSLPHARFHAGVRRRDGSEDGVGFASRLSLAPLDVTALSGPGEVDAPWPRVVVRTRIEAPSRALVLVNAHLSADPKENEEDILALLAALREVREPTVLLGDLGVVPEAPAVRRLREAGFVDAWRRLRPAADGYTFEAGGRDQRVDYVFVSAALAPNLEEIHLSGKDKLTGEVGSDHRGLVVKLDL